MIERPLVGVVLEMEGWARALQHRPCSASAGHRHGQRAAMVPSVIMRYQDSGEGIIFGNPQFCKSRVKTQSPSSAGRGDSALDTAAVWSAGP